MDRGRRLHPLQARRSLAFCLARKEFVERHKIPLENALSRRDGQALGRALNGAEIASALLPV